MAAGQFKDFPVSVTLTVKGSGCVRAAATSSRPVPEFVVSRRQSSTMESETKKCTDCVASRWIFAVLGSIGFMIVYGLKVNLSVAIIAMVNHTAVTEAAAELDDHGSHHAVFSNDTNSTSVNLCGEDDHKEELNVRNFQYKDQIFY
ncbi:hypothetical protein FHG87_012488 [Trinorchestia longiramus]|nr:hypothetical protein FHG87_012488 [Trinorchestia longiramus]